MRNRLEIFLTAVLMLSAAPLYAASSSQPSEFALFEEVPKVFSASKIDEPLLEAPAAISVLTSDDLEDWGILDLPDAFRYVPGMDVTAFNGREWGVTARGMNERLARRMLVLVDGVSVYGPMLSGVGWATLPLLNENIDSVEVIRGPNDTLYGFNAFNGVINIKTKKPEDAQGLFSRYFYGTNDHSKYVARYGDSVRFGEESGLDFYTSYSHEESQGYGDNRGDGFPDGRWPHQANVRAVYTINSKVNLDSSFGITTGPQQQGQITSNGSSYLSYIDFYYTQNRLNFQSNDHSRGYLQFYHWQRVLDAKFMSSGLSTNDSEEKQYDIEAQNQFDFLDGRSNTVVGGNFRVNSVKSLNIRQRISDHAGQNTYDSLYSVFFNEKFVLLKDRKALKKLTAVAGLRMEGSELVHDPRWAPRASLLYEPVQNNVFRTTYARAYRLPSFLEEFAEVPTPANTDGTAGGGTTSLLRGNRNIKDESVDSYEIGYSGQYLKNKLTFDADTFWANYHGIVRLNPLQQGVLPLISSLDNSMLAHSYGVELAGAWRVYSWLKIFANYTFERIVNSDQTSVSRSYEDSTPFNKVTTGANFKFREGSDGGHRFLDGWNFNFLMHYRDAYNAYDETAFSINTFGIKPDVRFDLHVSKSFFDEGLEIGFIGQNLVSANHHEASFVPVPRLLFVTVTLRGWPWEFRKPAAERQNGLIRDNQAGHRQAGGLQS